MTVETYWIPGNYFFLITTYMNPSFPEGLQVHVAKSRSHCLKKRLGWYKENKAFCGQYTWKVMMSRACDLWDLKNISVAFLQGPKNKIENYMKTFWYREIFFIHIQIIRVLGKNDSPEKTDVI